MDLRALAATVTKYGAPLLGSVIAGPAGAAIGQLVAQAFGGDVKDTDNLINKIISDPDSYNKIIDIESNNKLELQRILIQSELDKLKLQTQNTENAREMSLKNNSIYPQLLSSLVVIGFFTVIYWVAAFPQDQADHDVLYILLGVLGTSFGAVINFWLGSSADKSFSSQKL